MTGEVDNWPSLDRTFAGAYGAFGVTNFWEHLPAEREGAQATAMARATRNAGFPDRVSFIADSRNPSGVSLRVVPTIRVALPRFDHVERWTELLQAPVR